MLLNESARDEKRKNVLPLFTIGKHPVNGKMLFLGPFVFDPFVNALLKPGKIK